MQFASPLLEARLVRRYKRFLADVEWPDGSVTTVHCPNTGSMLGCQAPGSPVWVSRATNPRRKYPLTWELVQTANGTLVGINTGRTNALVREALADGQIAELGRFDGLKAEVRLPASRSRVDFVLRNGAGSEYFLEVKNVTAAVVDGCALFPDAVSARAARHARELRRLRRAGHGLLFCVQRGDVARVRPADEIDPDYGTALREAAADGVDVLAYRARVTPQGIAVQDRIEVVL